MLKYACCIFTSFLFFFNLIATFEGLLGKKDIDSR